MSPASQLEKKIRLFCPKEWWHPDVRYWIFDRPAQFHNSKKNLWSFFVSILKPLEICKENEMKINLPTWCDIQKKQFKSYSIPLHGSISIHSFLKFPSISSWLFCFRLLGSKSLLQRPLNELILNHKPACYVLSLNVNSFIHLNVRGERTNSLA